MVTSSSFFPCSPSTTPTLTSLPSPSPPPPAVRSTGEVRGREGRQEQKACTLLQVEEGEAGGRSPWGAQAWARAREGRVKSPLVARCRVCCLTRPLAFSPGLPHSLAITSSLKAPSTNFPYPSTFTTFPSSPSPSTAPSTF